MSVNSNKYNTGMNKWDNVSSRKRKTTYIEPYENTIVTILPTQIKTSIPDKSFKVVDEKGDLKFHFFIDEITSFDLVENTIYIYMSDEIPFVIHFACNDDAEIGNERINDIINGGNIQ